MYRESYLFTMLTGRVPNIKWGASCRLQRSSPKVRRVLYAQSADTHIHT